jgi:pre-mRNA-splicing helicase BRR2
MEEDLSKYKYEEISNKVLRADKRLLDSGSLDSKIVDTTPQSLKGKISSKDFGSNLVKINDLTLEKEIGEEREKLRKSIQSSLDAFESKEKHKNKLKKSDSRSTRNHKSSSLLATNSLETLNYIPTTESNLYIYNQIISWCDDKLDKDLPDDIISSLTDIIIEVLKSDDSNTNIKKKEIEETISLKLQDDDFQKLYSLVNSISDYKKDIVNVDVRSNIEDDGLEIVLNSDYDEDENEDENADENEEDTDDDNHSTNDDENNFDLINQNIEDDDNIVKLVTAEDESNKLDITSIDKYWISRQLSKWQSQIDSYKYEEISKSIFNSLEEAIKQQIDLKTFERKISDISDFEINEFYYQLIKNYKVIYYAIKLTQTENESEKSRIQKILNNVTTGVNKRFIDSVDTENSVKRRKLIETGKIAPSSETKYPRSLDLHNLVFTQGSKLMTVSKFELPKGSFKRTKKSWEEIHIPAPEKAKQTEDEILIPISELPNWAHSVFPSTEMRTLNRIQSKVYPKAFEDDCNILMCAPTGAGKTNVAMLTVLRTLSDFKNSNGKFQSKNFKIVYIAPLKALVQEQVREFDRRLSHLGITVNELTGDSNLTKHQIESTQILVTTPEKWDVITRKNNDASYINLVKLIIIDEIHLLHDERGPVLESIVSRTIKNMDDNNENKVRLVGLSATLPNYTDVARFLRVEKEGLFYFDASYRPCPLAQQFIGITEKKAFKKYESMNQVCYEKVVENITNNNQVIIFVHSRKETAKTAKWLANKLEEEKLTNLMSFSAGVKNILRSESENAKNKGLKSVLPMGFGIHHAGMNREDRQTAEDLFAEGHIKVLVSTATLAWGVNLPAHTVIIKGTSVYSPEKGTWIDLSPQDILQMLGRAGRPRYDTHGDGIIITSQEQIKYYLAVLNQQLPIESQMYAKLADSINAEIVSGSVRSLKDCVTWLGYTYLYVRMLHSRDIYFVGPQYDNDPDLFERRKDLGYSALLLLAKNGMIKYNYTKDIIVPTTLGKIASYYYISYANMKHFDSELKPTSSEIELFRLFAESEEFKYIHVKREEKIELQKLIEKAPIPINESVEDPLSKINILLQAYISGLKLDGFALMADMIFISQSAGRLFRALYDLALTKHWAKLVKILLNICKMIEKKLWLTSTPLRQFPNVPQEIISTAEKSLTPFKYYFQLTEPSLIVKALKAERYGNLASELILKFPKIDVDYNVRPITPSLLQIELEITPKWKWDTAIHGFTESFTLLVDDCDGEKILYQDRLLVSKNYINQTHNSSFFIPLFEDEQPNYFISVISDTWLYCENRKPLLLTKLEVPKKFPASTPLIESGVVPIRDLGIKEFVGIFPFDYFNKFQSQAFDSVYNGNENILFATSKGNGKTTLALLALLKHWKDEGGRAIYINPNQIMIDFLLKKWEKTLSKLAGGKVINKFTGDVNIDLQILSQSHLVLCTPSQIEEVSRRWQQRKSLQTIELIIADDCHTIGYGFQGTLYECSLSRLSYINSNLENKLRFILLSSSIASYKDIADWINIPKTNIFDFDARERVYPLEVKFEHYDIFHNPSLLKCLIRPAYNYIKTMELKNDNKCCLVFVSERKDVTDVAKQFLRKLQIDSLTWLNVAPGAIDAHLKKIQDSTLKLCLKFGIGFYHENLASTDRNIVFSCLEAGILKCVVMTKDFARYPFSATDVLVLGTKEYDGKEHTYVDYSIDDLLEMIGLARKNTSSVASAVVYTNSSKVDYYKRFVALPLPFESHLNNFICDAIVRDIKIIKNRQDVIDWLTYSLFYRRLQLNPSFYKVTNTSKNSLSEFLSELVEDALTELETAGLIELNIEEDETEEHREDEEIVAKAEIVPLNTCIIANYYNVAYSTMEILSKLNEKMRLKKILEVICLATEFENIPIRENEGSVLFKLYNSVPLKWSMEVNFESAGLKTFVLLQAYFSRISLSPELHSDLNEILPIAIRLLYASIDILSSQGYLNAMFAMDLCQMVTQGLWNNDNALKQVPFFNDKIISRCEKYKVGSVYDIMELEDDDRDELLEGLSSENIIAVAEFVNKYPNLEITYHLEGDVIAGEPKQIDIEINRDEEAEDLSIVSATYPMKRLENWWVVIGDTKNNELYSIKKLAITKNSQIIKMNFTIPESGNHDVFIWCVCDSYMEADKQVEIKSLLVKDE